MFYYNEGMEIKNGKVRQIISQSAVSIEGRVPMDETAATALLAQYANEDRIAELKHLLSDTDYIACKIAEGAATAEEYAEAIAQRQAWRDEINQLEN